MQSGDWQRAESLLAQAVESCQIDPDARRNYAETLWHRGATREAVAQLEHAIQLSRHDPTLTMRAGELYLQLGDTAAARQKARETLQVSASVAAGWTLRGRVNAAEGHLREALADYHRSMSFGPLDADVLLETAQLYYRLGEPQRALSTLQQLIDTYPTGQTPPTVLHLEGLVLTQLRRYDEAVDRLAAAARVDQPGADVYYDMAQAHMLARRPAAAQGAAERALSLDPTHQPSRQLLGEIAAARRRGTTRR